MRFPASDIVLHHGSLIRRMRDRQQSFATLAPISIPANVHAAIDTLLGVLTSGADPDVHRVVVMSNEARVWAR
jgi:hypothetical protein